MTNTGYNKTQSIYVGMFWGEEDSSLIFGWVFPFVLYLKYHPLGSNFNVFWSNEKNLCAVKPIFLSCHKHKKWLQCSRKNSNKCIWLSQLDASLISFLPDVLGLPHPDFPDSMTLEDAAGEGCCMVSVQTETWRPSVLFLFGKRPNSTCESLKILQRSIDKWAKNQ